MESVHIQKIVLTSTCSGDVSLKESSLTCYVMCTDILPFGLRRNPVWRDISNVKRERAVWDGYGIEIVGSDRGILLGIILNFCHFLSDLMGLTFYSMRYGQRR